MKPASGATDARVILFGLYHGTLVAVALDLLSNLYFGLTLDMVLSLVAHPLLLALAVAVLLWALVHPP
jgi:hypothetical protein